MGRVIKVNESQLKDVVKTSLVENVSKLGRKVARKVMKDIQPYTSHLYRDNDFKKMISESVMEILRENEIRTRGVQTWIQWFLKNSHEGVIQPSNKNIISVIKSIPNEEIWGICCENTYEYNYIYDLFDENDVDVENDMETCGYYAKQVILDELSDITRYIDKNNNIIISRDITIDNNKLNFDNITALGDCWSYGDYAFAYCGDNAQDIDNYTVLRITGKVNVNDINWSETISVLANSDEKEIRPDNKVEVNKIEIVRYSNPIQRYVIWEGNRIMNAR